MADKGTVRVMESNRRDNLLRLQWALVVVTSFLLYFNDPDPSLSFVDAAIATFLAANIFVSFFPGRYFDKTVLYYSWVLCNILFGLLAVSLAEPAASTLYLFFFLVLIVAAAGHSPMFRIFGVLAIVGLYAWGMMDSAGQLLFSPSLLLRISFLLIAGFFFGYLVQMKTEREEHWVAPPELTSSLLEFGKALAQADDLDSLRSDIPKLIHHTMSVDACELVIIEEGQIVRRIFQDQREVAIPLLAVEKSIHQKSLDTAGPYVSRAFQEDSNLIQKEDFSFYPYQAYMGTAWAHGQLSGVVAVYRKEEGPWSNADIKKFGFLVDQAVLSLDYAHLLQELESQARTDGLTGLANHRYFYDRLEEELSRAQRQNRPLSVIMMDLDELKLINDTYGHLAGDEILRRFAGLLRAITRRMDIAARYGGDEFAVVLPETGAKQAHVFCNRILKEVATLKLEEISGISISMGISTFPEDGEAITNLIDHADQALYHAKSQSRGGTYLHTEDPKDQAKTSSQC